MSQQEFELQHAAKLLAKGPRKIWRLENKTRNGGFRSEPYQTHTGAMDLSNCVA
jgi:hypothetical protein